MKNDSFAWYFSRKNESRVKAIKRNACEKEN